MGGMSEAANDDSDDDEGDPDDDRAALLFRNEGDDSGGDIAAAGDVNWAAVVDKSYAAGGLHRLPSGEGCSDSRNTHQWWCSRGSWRLPLPLVIFTLPCIALIPFYLTIYRTSLTAVSDVLVAQVSIPFVFPSASI